MPIMGTCETCGGVTLENCCIVCMTTEIRELRERELQRKAKVERLRKDQQWMHALIGQLCGLFPNTSPLALLEKVERLQKFAKTEYQRGLDEGSSCQAILEIQGQERFLTELKADGCPKCPHKEEVERLRLYATAADIPEDVLAAISNHTQAVFADMGRAEKALCAVGFDGETLAEIAGKVVVEVTRLQTVVADMESKCQSLVLANDFQCSEVRRLTALLVSRGDEVKRLEREHKEEVDEFNAGWEAASRGEPIENDPDPPQDNWRNGWCARHGDQYHAIVDKLHKCWGLNKAGELVQDVPATPEMTVFGYDPDLGIGKGNVLNDVRQAILVWSIDTPLGWTNQVWDVQDCSSTQAAAEAAKGK